MKRFLQLLVLAAFIVNICGCANVMRIGPGGASPGLIFTETTYPNYLNPNMEYRINFDADDIELIGSVRSEAMSKNFLGLVSVGDSGYGELLQQARAMGADGVMNITVDTTFKNILFVYFQATTELTGQAYRYKRP
ncbi:hypothetical protein JXA32_04760 [Candidatus Sumerlaeota bacterium]|nr:hypothetical protein [Candidatus Sumerlaeota bacterium]